MYVQLQEFLTGWEPLSAWNSEKYIGVTQRDMGRLFRAGYPSLDVKNDNELFSHLCRLVKQLFGIKFRKWTYVDTGERMKYCELQPKDVLLWIHLHEFPVGYGSNVFTGEKFSMKRKLARGSFEPVLDKEEDSLCFDDVCVDGVCKKVCKTVDECSFGNDVGLGIVCDLSDGKDNSFSNNENDGDGNVSNNEQDINFSEDEEKECTPLSNIGRTKSIVKKSLFSSLPPLDSPLMHAYAEKQMENAPYWIRQYLQTQQVDSGLDLAKQERIFITKEIREELDINGFAVVRQLFSKELLEETLKYIQLKQQAEGVDESSYQNLSRHRYSVGLVTKHGWTKMDYVGLAQQVITASPNLYTCVSELYGTSRLLPNFYEYKYNFGRSDSKKFYEFIHSDCNYAQLLFAEQLGIPVDNTYQFIVPLTSMSPKTTTVYIAKGFHRHWKDATYRSMKAGHWTRCGWKTCDPEKQFLPEDYKNLIGDQFVGLSAEPGDLIIFSSLLPHGPNVNSTSDMRVALYPFLAPYLASKEQRVSYLPNGLESVKKSVLTGACPKYSAHPWCNYELSKISRLFYSRLPTVQLPRTLLGDCLFGFQPWTEFEKSKVAKYLFKPDSAARNAVVEIEEDRVISALRTWNTDTSILLESHQNHVISDSMCKLCKHMEDATLLEWWHSTEAIYHQIRGCTCVRCEEISQNGWHSWKQQGGCTCPLCK